MKSSKRVFSILVLFFFLVSNAGAQVLPSLDSALPFASLPATPFNISHTYHAGSRLLTANNGYSKITYTYDALNRVTQESEVLGSETYPVKSAYDKAGNRTSVTYPSGKVIGYTYNALNLVVPAQIDIVILPKLTLCGF